MCCASARSSRQIVEECLIWSTQRRVFGQPLVAQAVIRAKLSQMIAKVEAGQAWLENITYQMTKMDYKQQSEHLAGVRSLLGRMIQLKQKLIWTPPCSKSLSSRCILLARLLRLVGFWLIFIRERRALIAKTCVRLYSPRCRPNIWRSRDYCHGHGKECTALSPDST